MTADSTYWRRYYEDVITSGRPEMDYYSHRRQQEEFLALLKLCGPLAGARVCDAGCGRGGLARLLWALDVRELVAFDLVAEAVGAAEKGFEDDFVDPGPSSGRSWRFETASLVEAHQRSWAQEPFDLVVSCEVVQCVGMSRGLEALWQLTAPGGRMVVSSMSHAASHLVARDTRYELVDRNGLEIALKRLPSLAGSWVRSLRYANDQRLEVFDSREVERLEDADGFIIVAARGA